MSRALVFLSLLLLLPLAGCGDAEESTTSSIDENLVIASFGPMGWLCQSLLAPERTVHVLTPEGVDPKTFRPGRDLVRDVLLPARLIVVNGAGAEGWLDQVELPRSRLLDTTAGLKDQLIDYEYSHDHGDEGHGGHSHGGGAHVHKGTHTHTWVDPLLLRDQARALAAEAARIWPTDAAKIAARLSDLEKGLEALHADVAGVLPKLAGADGFAVNSDALAYLLKRHEVTGKNLGVSSARTLAGPHLEKIDRARKGRVMLWDGRPDGPDFATWTSEEAARKWLAREQAGSETQPAPTWTPMAVWRDGTRLRPGEDWMKVQRASLAALKGIGEVLDAEQGKRTDG